MADKLIIISGIAGPKIIKIGIRIMNIDKYFSIDLNILFSNRSYIC